MKKTERLWPILLCAVFLIWLFPWEGKKELPWVFDSAFLQWGSTLATALLCPIGALFALDLIWQGRRHGYFLFVGFGLPIVTALLMHGAFMPLMARGRMFLSTNYQDFPFIERISQQARSPKRAFTDRNRFAGTVYQFWGIQTFVLNDDGGYSPYTATADDKAGFRKTQQQWESIKQSQQLIDWQLRQSPWVFSVYLGGPVIIGAIGLGVFAFRRKPGAHVSGGSSSTAS